MNGKYVAYYRVSTGKQAASGLGLEAQKKAVTDFLNGGNWQLLEEFVEVESGTNSDRVQLQRALRSCRIQGATLLVAKLDRLARNAHFLLGLQQANVDFVACDLPAANRLTIGILSLVAEEEARAVSARTRAALQAAKARGVRLGTPGNLTRVGMKRGVIASARARADAARRLAQDLAPTISQIQQEGAHSLRQIAQRLNSMNYPAPRAGSWSATQVQRVIARLNT